MIESRNKSLLFAGILKMKMRLLTCLLSLPMVCSNAIAQDVAVHESSDNRPLVLGHGVGLFRIGELLAQDDFENLDNWVVQIQEKSGFDPAHVVARENSLDCLLPGRGCTVWFKEKLPTRVTITYDVICPTPQPPIRGVQPRDINNFWMATDSVDPDQGLFDSTRYTGAFGSYDKMHGYYASTGGGGAKAANLTTRMRRYPREVGGKPAEHVALNDKDGKAGYLITPDKVMSVQLVAYDDVIQYIVDGKLIYQIAGGDPIQIEGPDADGEVARKDGTYDLERFPVYREGYFGFRMVGTHHIYRDFRVYTLEPHDADSRSVVNVSTVAELRSAMEGSDQKIIMKSGKYEIGSESLHLSGDNNIVDLTGAYFSCEVSQAGSSRMNITGDGNTICNGEFEDVYYNGMEKVTDFTAYNQDRKRLANGGGTNIRIKGDNNLIVGLKVTVRGSFPYGYGAMFGIGRNHSFKLSKHAGILVTGKNTVLDGVEVYQQAFCHGIYIQSPADNTVIKNSLVEGVMRATNDMYAEIDPNSLPYKYDYKMPFSIVGSPNEPGTPIPRDHMFTLTEDGIRVYRGGGSVRVENTTVKKTRGGIRTYLGSGATILNCTAIDCGSTNFNLPKGGTIKGSSGNFAYGPLSDFRLGKSNQSIALTILSSPNAMGDHNIADIQGDNHTIVFHRSPGPRDKTTRAIVVTGNNSTIRNETEYSIVLERSASGNSVASFGAVIDRGNNNNVTRIEKPAG